MKRQRLTGVPGVKDFKGMNIINSLMYHKEALKREQDTLKKKVLQKRLEELKLELENYKANNNLTLQ